MQSRFFQKEYDFPTLIPTDKKSINCTKSQIVSWLLITTFYQLGLLLRLQKQSFSISHCDSPISWFCFTNWIRFNSCSKNLYNWCWSAMDSKDLPLFRLRPSKLEPTVSKESSSFKVIHPKCYKHFKDTAELNHLSRQKWASFQQISFKIHKNKSI